MSRNRPTKTDLGYALVELKCPDGHLVGNVLVQSPTGWATLLDGRMHSLRRIAPIPAEGKEKFRCAQCEKDGTWRDLQVSWARINGALATAVDDPTVGRVGLVLG